MRRSTSLALHAAVVIALCAVGCRIETVAPGGAQHAATTGTGTAVAAEKAPRGDLWVYTSMYRSVIDALGPLLEERMPEVTIHWYQAGSEKIASRLEAERTAGGVRADVLATSDPFLYRRLTEEKAFLRYASPYALRIPRALVDLDAHWVSGRLSTMVLVHRTQVTAPPGSFRELTEKQWNRRVALGDPMTSGTAFTWAVFMHQRYGESYFQHLRQNQAIVAGGNAAVLQKVESGEADVGVLLLENALTARANGSKIEIVYPADGAVVIPGPFAILESTANPAAAKAFVDVVLSPEGQRIIVEKGEMHAVDARLPGPRGQVPLEVLLERAQPWTDELLETGVRRGSEVKNSFAEAFAQ